MSAASDAIKRGNELLVAGEVNQAVKAFSDAVNAEPEHIEALAGLSAALLKAGQSQQALDAAERAIEVDNSNGKGWLRKGQALLEHGNKPGAAEAASQGLECDPSNRALRSLLKKTGVQAPSSVAPGNVNGNSILTCKRLGCGLEYKESSNNENSCRYHPGPPLFHDGRQVWKCCGSKAPDFDAFLKIPGCKTGRHDNSKAAVPAAASSGRVQRLQQHLDAEKEAISAPQRIEPVKLEKPVESNPRETCPRCKGGYLCQEHGVTVTSYQGAKKQTKDVAQNNLNPSDPRRCKNLGCQQMYVPSENSEDACTYHEGPPQFHDSAKKWLCCGKSSHDFDQWLKIPGCKRGPHR